jgi:predicted transposase/invertase (TIGR01784 family)
MRFINPKTDYAFKKIFGSEQSHDILISFLNAILYEGNNTIIDLEIIAPSIRYNLRGFSKSSVNIQASIRGTSQTPQNIIIKIQILNESGFEKNILYNSVKAEPLVLEISEPLENIIALTIADFEMFPELDHLLSRFILKEKTYLTDYPIYDIELVFIELPKFQKQLVQLETLADKWLYFLKTARKLESVPPSMESIPEIKQAFAIANQANLSLEEIDELEHQEIFIQDQRNAIKKALDQGIEQVIEQGKLEEKLAIAQQLLNVLDDAAISRTIGLSIEAIVKLRNN